MRCDWSVWLLFNDRPIDVARLRTAKLLRLKISTRAKMQIAIRSRLDGMWLTEMLIQAKFILRFFLT